MGSPILRDKPTRGMYLHISNIVWCCDRGHAADRMLPACFAWAIIPRYSILCGGRQPSTPSRGRCSSAIFGRTVGQCSRCATVWLWLVMMIKRRKERREDAWIELKFAILLLKNTIFCTLEVWQWETWDDYVLLITAPDAEQLLACKEPCTRSVNQWQT